MTMHKQTLYLMVGFPGSGKTTAAQCIAELTGSIHIWADKERKHMFGTPKYHAQETRILYEELNQVAELLLQKGESVVYDTNFNFYKDRQRLREIARKHAAETLIVWVRTPKEIARDRAVHKAHEHTHTRILGSMSNESFERLSGNLQPPRKNERHIELTGTKITPEYVHTKLDEVV